MWTGRSEADAMKQRAGWVVAVILMGLAAPAAADRLEQSIPIAPGGTLSIELDAGSIEIETHDEARVEIDARASGWGEMKFELEHDENEVELVGSFGGWLSGLGGGRVRVRARVPEHFDLNLRTSGGNIEVQDLQGDVDAETSGGTIDLKEVEGEVSAETSGGGITAQEIRGALEVKTSGGPIHVSEVSGPVQAETSGGGIRIRDAGAEVDARTSGGSVAVRFAGMPEGHVETSGGSIEIELPEGAGVDLEAGTSGGRVEIDSSIQVDGSVSRHEVSGELNGGGESLDLRTSGGNIRIRTR